MQFKERAVWKEHGFGSRFTDLGDADEINDREFDQSVIPGTVKVSLNHIIRKDLGAKGEWLLYHYVLIGTHKNTNRPYYRAKTEGYWQRPIFDTVYDERTGITTEIDRVAQHEDVYEIPYSPDNVKKILVLDEMNNNVGMTLMPGNGGLHQVCDDLDAFINEDFRSLYQKLRNRS
jgi:hypothetical protein